MSLSPVSAMLVVAALLLVTPQHDAKITKPLDKWICDYCAMGGSLSTYLQSQDLVDIILLQGPELNPDECGAPILCIFYGLLGTIFLFAIYSNIKGNSHSEY